LQQSGKLVDERGSGHGPIATRFAGLHEPVGVHVRSEADDAQGAGAGGGAEAADQADGIERHAIQIDNREDRAVGVENFDRRVRGSNEDDAGARRGGGGPDLGLEQQVVHDREDHGKMITDMVIRTAAVPPFFKNGYLLTCETTREAVLIDPGDEVDSLLESAAADRASIKTILLTHAHLDHVTGVAAAKAATGAPIWIHRDDLFLYNGVVEQGRMFGLRVSPQPTVDAFYEPGRVLEFGDQIVDVRHTPGHSPGGVCLAIGRATESRRDLFVGDTLFAGSIGRTDLPGGDLETLLNSIRSVLFGYPDDTPVYSGHGPATTIGVERTTNPFLV
jgi:hydroxyacylglutathione hydrolase